MSLDKILVQLIGCTQRMLQNVESSQGDFDPDDLDEFVEQRKTLFSALANGQRDSITATQQDLAEQLADLDGQLTKVLNRRMNEIENRRGRMSRGRRAIDGYHRLSGASKR